MQKQRRTLLLSDNYFVFICRARRNGRLLDWLKVVGLGWLVGDAGSVGQIEI